MTKETSRGAGPPAYPLRIGPREARAFTIAGLSNRPAMVGEIKPREDTPQIRRIVRQHIADQTVRRQLEAWARARANPKDQDLSFARSCRLNGWGERTAERNVEDALALVFLVLNCPET